MNRRLIFFFTLIFAAGIGIGALAVFSSVHQPQTQSRLAKQEASASGEVAGAGSETATVKRVIDGDTIELTNGKKVRYIGINTPETVDPRKPVECFGKEASARNKELVSGKDVEIEKDVSETDRYGRLLRYVYVVLPGQGRVMVNELLVKEGFAQSDTFPPDVKYQELFLNAERSAREQNLGLWGSCAGETYGVATSSGQINRSVPNFVPGNPPPTHETSLTTKPGCLIKGNISSGGKIYHLPGCGSYDKTVIDESVGERWFCSEDEAIKAGWRKAKNC